MNPQGARLCSRCRQRPASGKHAWCGPCKKGRGGPPAPEARTRRQAIRERNAGEHFTRSDGTELGTDTVTAIDAPAATRGNNEHRGNNTEGDARQLLPLLPHQERRDARTFLPVFHDQERQDPPTARSLDELREPTAHVDAPAALTTTATRESVATGTRSAESESAQIDAPGGEPHAPIIPPAGAVDSFPPSLVGFVRLIALPKKNEGQRGTEGERPAEGERGERPVVDIVDTPKSWQTGELCAAPLLVPIRADHPNVVCVSCLAVGVRGEFTEDHPIRLCPGGTVEMLRWEPNAPRCALCWRSGDDDTIAHPHPIGRRAFCERPDAVKLAAWHECRWCGRRGGPFGDHHAEPIRSAATRGTA